MNKFDPVIIYLAVCFTIISCSQNQRDLRKLTPEENIQNIISNIDNKEMLNESPVRINVKGDTISKDSISRLNPDSIGFDNYVNNKNEVKLVVERHITPEDIEARKKWDSLLTFDRQLLLKFADLVAKDSLEKQGIIDAYKYKYQSLIPLKISPVNCDSIYDYLFLALEKDQKVRDEKQRKLYQTVDRKNQEILLSIIECCGFKSISDAGSESIHATFMIIQHGPRELQKKYFPMLKEWSLQGLLKPSTLALMIDRILIGGGEKQLFGSQIRTYDSGKSEVLPIENLERVDFRRDSVGLEPLADYLSRFGIAY